MVDIHQELGDGSKPLDVLQVIFTMIKNGVHPIISLLVIITPLANMDLADQANQLQLAKNHVLLAMKRVILMTNGMFHLLIQSHQMFKKYKLKS